MKPHTITADFDEIIFEGKNKSYGAYEMRSHYSRYLGRAALLAMLLFLTGTSVPKMVSWFMPPEIISLDDESLSVTPVIMEGLPEFDEPEKLILPPEPELPEPAASIEFTVPVPDPEVREEETIHEVSELGEKPIGTEDVEGTGEVDWEKLEKTKPETGGGFGEISEPGHLDFVDVDEEPKPVNMKQFTDAVGYPPLALEAGIGGKVSVRVQVDKNGDYVKHVVLKNPHPILTHAVEAQLKLLKFTPGIQAGKPIKVWVTIPVEFIPENK